MYNKNIYDHLFVSPLFLDENFVIKNFERFPGENRGKQNTVFGPNVNPRNFATMANTNIKNRTNRQNNNSGFMTKDEVIDYLFQRH